MRGAVTITTLLAAGCWAAASGCDETTETGGEPRVDVACPVPDVATPGVDAVDVPEPPELSRTEWLFDDHAPPRHFRITVDPVDWAWLQDNATAEEYVPASVELDGDTFDGAGVRYKGGYGSLYSCFDEQGNRTCPKLSIKVSFNEYVDKGRFMGVRKFVFNSCNRDPTCLRERLAYAMFREAGITAPRAVHALVSVNGQPLGLYLLVENPDKELVEDNYDLDHGNLYKEVWPQHLEPQPYLAALRTNEEQADVSRMVAFAELLAGVVDADFLTAAAPWIDAERMLRYFVVDQLTHNWDGIWKFYCQGEFCRNHNFYVYDDPESGRFEVIPWDLDHTFSLPNPDMARSWHDDGPNACDVQQQGWIGIRAPQCDRLLEGLMLLQWEEYLDALLAATRGEAAPLTEEAVMARLDRYRATILPHVLEDPLGPDSMQWRRQVARLRQIVREQYREAARLLEETGHL